ncbi:hypothetical protein ACV1EH_20730 [Aeromonas caviae]
MTYSIANAAAAHNKLMAEKKASIMALDVTVRDCVAIGRDTKALADACKLALASLYMSADEFFALSDDDVVARLLDAVGQGCAEVGDNPSGIDIVVSYGSRQATLAGIK